MDNKQIIEWLLEGDVSIQYQVYCDLLSEKSEDLRKTLENLTIVSGKLEYIKNKRTYRFYKKVMSVFKQA